MNGDVMNMLSSVMQDPKAMEKAISMARALSSSGILEGLGASDTSNNTQNAGTSESPQRIANDVLVPGTSNEGHKISMEHRIALLLAIRPYLAKDKAEKLDFVVSILKVIGMIENSGIKLF